MEVCSHLVVSGLTPDRHLIEVRYARRLALLDYLGAIADELGDTYAEYDIMSDNARFSSPEEGADLVVGVDRVALVREGGREVTTLAALAQAMEVVQKFLGVTHVDYVGARQVLLVPLDDVAEATSWFRERLFDYRSGAFEAIGDEPVEAQLIVASRVHGGRCRLRVTSVYSGRKPANLDADQIPGALLVDVDRSDDTGCDVWQIEARVQDLLTDGFRRAVDFYARLDESHTKEDHPVVGHG